MRTMIRFRHDDKSNVEQGNKRDGCDKVKYRLVHDVILSILAFSLSANVGLEFRGKVDQMFAETKVVHKAKTSK
jgi:hypothetical protein